MWCKCPHSNLITYGNQTIFRLSSLIVSNDKLKEKNVHAFGLNLPIVAVV